LSVIDHGHLRPSEAATRFRNSHIDATDVDFSDRIASKRKSYVASTRRSRRRQTGFDDYGDEEEEEVGGSGGEADSLERRLAMLRREVEELRAEVNKKKEQAENGETVVKPETSSGIEEVATMLSALEGDGKGRGAQARLARKMATSLGVVGQVTREIPGPSAEDPGEKDQV
jgi:nuclear migration protein JNM1